MKIVYIDAQNVHKSLETYHKRTISWEKFFVYCKEKFHIDEVKIFFGYIEKYVHLYKKLENIGYTICFKEALVLSDGTIKGNVDIDIAIVGLRDWYENGLTKAYVVTGDGDYNSLIDFWQEKNVLGCVLLPGIKNSSILLRKSAKKNIIDLVPLQKKLQKENPGFYS